MRLRSLLGKAYLALAACASPAIVAASGTGWSPGVEDQRVPDLGDGTYLNPILSGDHPDPAIS